MKLDLNQAKWDQEVDSENILYSCVMDNKPKYIFQTFCLIWSLLDMARVPANQISVHAIEGCSENVLGRLNKLGIQVINIQPFSKKYPHCNKIGQLSNLKTRNFDVAVLLDTDMIVTQPIFAAASTTSIRARIVGGANPPIERLRELFSEAGFEKFPGVCKTANTNQPTYSVNVNGGLYFLPKHILLRLDEAWQKWANWLLANQQFCSEKTSFFLDQIAFGMAVHSLGIDVSHLPIEMNYPVRRCGKFPMEKPAVIHYHGYINSSGLLNLPAFNSAVNSIIEDVNNAIARRLRLDFEEKLFWHDTSKISSSPANLL